METQSPEEIDNIISGLNGPDADGYVDYQDMSADMTQSAGGPEVMDMMSQEGAMSTGGMEGLTPESGGMYANPNQMVG